MATDDSCIDETVLKQFASSFKFHRQSVSLVHSNTFLCLCAGYIVGHICLCAGHVMLLAILSAQHACVLVCRSCCWPYYLHNTLVCLCAGHVVGHIIYTKTLCACVQVMLLAILSTQHPCVLVCRSCCWPY